MPRTSDRRKELYTRAEIQWRCACAGGGKAGLAQAGRHANLPGRGCRMYGASGERLGTTRTPGGTVSQPTLAGCFRLSAFWSLTIGGASAAATPQSAFRL